MYNDLGTNSFDFRIHFCCLHSFIIFYIETAKWSHQIGTLRAKDLRKNEPILQEVGSTHVPHTQPVFRVVLLHKRASGPWLISRYYNIISTFLVGILSIKYFWGGTVGNAYTFQIAFWYGADFKRSSCEKWTFARNHFGYRGNDRALAGCTWIPHH